MLEAKPAALFGELAAGKPVLVLQNLAFARLPVWHYAVVVGFDADRRRVVLRSGRRRRHTERLARFLATWALGGDWAFIALRPDELPAAGTPEPYVRALAAAEPLLGAAATRGYEKALERWPRAPIVLFAAGGHALEGQNYAAAVELYQRLLLIAPKHAAARNNLANALAAQGCSAEGLREARLALAETAARDPLRPAIEDTIAQLRSAPSTSSAAQRCSR